MKLFLFVVLTMSAFAGNSILNRVGVARFDMAPLDFAVIRTGAGVLMLWLLIALRRAPRPVMFTSKRFAGAAALAVYMIGFSLAYLTLDAGVGALILFGVLQVVMFGWALIEGQRVAMMRWVGAGIALIGLAVLLWPAGGAALHLTGAAAMIAAGVAWAAYTLLGRAADDALGATAVNFALCFVLVSLVLLAGVGGALTWPGVAIASAAGAVTSGLGYALWYKVLPQLETVSAALAQLSVPVIAVLGGVVLLGEDITWRVIVAGALVIGGIAVSQLRG